MGIIRLNPEHLRVLAWAHNQAYDSDPAEAFSALDKQMTAATGPWPWPEPYRQGPQLTDWDRFEIRAATECYDYQVCEAENYPASAAHRFITDLQALTPQWDSLGGYTHVQAVRAQTGLPDHGYLWEINETTISTATAGQIREQAEQLAESLRQFATDPRDFTMDTLAAQLTDFETRNIIRSLADHHPRIIAWGVTTRGHLSDLEGLPASIADRAFAHIETELWHLGNNSTHIAQAIDHGIKQALTQSTVTADPAIPVPSTPAAPEPASIPTSQEVHP
jgi:hypothetical protein